MSYGYCYDPTQPGWGGKVQSGTDAIRDVMLARVPELTDLGIIRDKSRCQQKSSTHCYGRAWDAGTPTVAINIKVGEFFVAAALDLGIQRVIGYGKRSDGTMGYREWDSRPGQRYWSRYSGPEHLSHNHVELCWEAARRLTVQQVNDAYDMYWPGQEDDDMKPEDWVRLENFIHQEVGLLAAALLAKDDDKAQAGGSHFDVPRGDSLMDVAIAARNSARKAAENTATPPAPPAAPVDAGDPTPEDPDDG